MTDPRTLKTLAFVLALAASTGPAAAQEPAPHAVTGTVVDARSGEPIEGAVVVLEPLPGGVLGPDRTSSTIRAGRTATTAGGGRYTFRGLPAGAYRLRVSRYAYEPATVEIDVRRGSAASVSVGLVVDPGATSAPRSSASARAAGCRATSARSRGTT